MYLSSASFCSFSLCSLSRCFFFSSNSFFSFSFCSLSRCFIIFLCSRSSFSICSVSFFCRSFSPSVSTNPLFTSISFSSFKRFSSAFASLANFFFACSKSSAAAILVLSPYLGVGLYPNSISPFLSFIIDFDLTTEASSRFTSFSAADFLSLSLFLYVGPRTISSLAFIFSMSSLNTSLITDLVSLYSLIRKSMRFCNTSLVASKVPRPLLPGTANFAFLR